MLSPNNDGLLRMSDVSPEKPLNRPLVPHVVNMGLPARYRDVGYAVVFALSLAVVGCGCAICLWLNLTGGPNTPKLDGVLLLAWLAITNMGAACLGVLLILVLQQGSPALLYVGLLEIALCLSLAVINRNLSVQISGAVAFTLALITLLWLLVVRRHIPFASYVLETASACLTLFPGAVGVAMGALLFVMLYMTAWSLALNLIYWLPSWIRPLWVVLCFFCLQWAAEVVRNVVCVTISGAVGLWYFTSEGSALAHPVQSALRRALSTSFGSICCGSSVFAAVIPVHSMLLSVQTAAEAVKSLNYVALVLSAVLHKLNPVMQHCNSYAFVHVALFGKSYSQAARDTWSLTMTCGLLEVFNGALLGTVPLLYSLLAGAIIGGVVESLTQNWFIFMVCALQAATVAGVVLTTCTSVGTTLLVCYAERPEGLQAIDAPLYAQISEAAVECAAAGLIPHSLPP